MKFNIWNKLVIISTLLVIIIATNVENKVETKTELKNQAGVKTKDKRTATDFFNELFTGNADLGDFLGVKTSVSKTATRNPSKTPINAATTAPGVLTSNNSTAATSANAPTTPPTQSAANTPNTNINTNSISNTISAPASNQPANNSTNMLLSDWLMISSPIFKNSLKFPPVTLPTGTQVEIITDSLFFRINDGFRADKVGDSTLPPTNKYFWFRLSGSNLYYSSTTTDINILGAVPIRYIVSVDNVPFGTGDACFIVRDLDNQDWKLCAANVEIRMKWVCQLQKVLGVQQEEYCGQQQQNNEHTVEVNKTVIQPIIIIPIPSPHCNEEWNYQQNGRDWNCDCAEGKEQAPIDLPVKERAIDSPIKPMFQYEEVSVTSPITTLEGQMREKENIKLQYVENTLRIFHTNMGKVVTLDGAIYYAQEIVIHTPAEHKIDGKSFDMEVQIIHYGQTKGDIAKQVVLCFLFEKKAGVYNKFLDDLEIFNLPNPISKQTDLLHNIFIPKILYSADNDDMPYMKPFSFYTYQGSLTNPPCTEKTIMYVASKPLYIGTTALQLFQEAQRIPDLMNQKGDVIVSNWIPMSNREVQPRNGRPVFHYDHEKNCGPDPVRPPPQEPGHYEKIMKSMTKYFYVSDEKPSGIPGAFVVSEKEALGKDLTTVR